MDTKPSNDAHSHSNNNTSIHFYSKHKYRDTFGDTHIQFHDFDNGDAFVYKDKYTALLHQEFKTPIGVYMIQSQIIAIIYLKTWI